jgi:CBS domain-containing protein
MNALDVMTQSIVSIRPEASVMDAARLMLDNRVSGLPVIDAEGTLVGIVTEGDFVRRAEIGAERRPLASSSSSPLPAHWPRTT